MPHTRLEKAATSDISSRLPAYLLHMVGRSTCVETLDPLCIHLFMNVLLVVLISSSALIFATPLLLSTSLPSVSCQGAPRVCQVVDSQRQAEGGHRTPEKSSACERTGFTSCCPGVALYKHGLVVWCVCRFHETLSNQQACLLQRPRKLFTFLFIPDVQMKTNKTFGYCTLKKVTRSSGSDLLKFYRKMNS